MMKKLSTLNSQLSTLKKGFTLIELLIVIAVLGVLAAVVLVAIDPVEQLSRARDAGRKSSVTELGRALQAYYTNNSGYPSPVGPPTWNTTLTTSGDIKVFPSQATAPIPATTCGAPGNMLNNFCYKLDAPGANIVVFTRLESKSERNKCVGAPANAWYIYQAIAGRAGVICQAAEPLATDPLYTFF